MQSKYGYLPEEWKQAREGDIIINANMLSKQSSVEGKSPKVLTIQQNTDVSWAQQKH